MNRGKRERREEWQREISDLHNLSLPSITQMNPVLTSEIDLNLQQPNTQLWRVRGPVITPGCTGDAATSVGPQFCPDRLSEVTAGPRALEME